jgi:hypothetical protein
MGRQRARSPSSARDSSLVSAPALRLISFQRSKAAKSAKLTLIILLHIKPSQQHNRLFAEQASIYRERRINALVHVNSHDAAGAAETVIETAEVDSADTELAKSGSAHDAGLDGHVEVGVVQDVGVVAGHDLRESDELGVAGALDSLC